MEYYTGDNPVVLVWWKMGLELEWSRAGINGRNPVTWRRREFPTDLPLAVNFYRVKPKEVENERPR